MKQFIYADTIGANIVKMEVHMGFPQRIMRQLMTMKTPWLKRRSVHSRKSVLRSSAGQMINHKKYDFPALKAGTP